MRELPPAASNRGLYLQGEGVERLDVVGDGVKIRRIVQNLLLNALKYTQSGGVTVTWGDSRAGDGEPLDAFGAGHRPGHSRRARGADRRGTRGRDAGRRERRGTRRCSERRRRGRVGERGAARPRPVRQEPGEGIGLSIVKRLCDLLDASVEVESTPGEGTVFRIVFPRSYAESTGIAAEPRLP